MTDTRARAIVDLAERWAIARAEHRALLRSICREGHRQTMQDALALQGAADRTHEIGARLYDLALPAGWQPATVAEQMALPLEAV